MGRWPRSKNFSGPLEFIAHLAWLLVASPFLMSDGAPPLIEDLDPAQWSYGDVEPSTVAVTVDEDVRGPLLAVSSLFGLTIYTTANCTFPIHPYSDAFITFRF